MSHFATPHFLTPHYDTPHFELGLQAEPPVVPLPSGGGGTVSAPGTHFNQAPPVIRDAELYIDQALMEDEELILFLRAFAEVIRWH